MPTRSPYNTLTAAGTTAADAAVVNADTVLLTGANAAGAILQDMDLNQEVVIVNGEASASFFIYPKSGGKFNNATADRPVTLPPNRAARFKAINNLDCIVFI